MENVEKIQRQNMQTLLYKAILAHNCGSIRTKILGFIRQGYQKLLDHFNSLESTPETRAANYANFVTYCEERGINLADN
jgi:hypothetical protein